MGELNRTILGQFIRGINGEELLNKLRLEDLVDSPPSFPDLLAAVRREESRRTERRLRHKKQAKAQMSIVSDRSVEEVSGVKQPQFTEVHQLQQKVKELEKQVNSFSQEKKVNRRGFGYRCGLDGHFATECENKINKSLVEEKAQARRAKFYQPKNW